MQGVDWCVPENGNKWVVCRIHPNKVKVCQFLSLDEKSVHIHNYYDDESGDGVELHHFLDNPIGRSAPTKAGA